MLKTVLNKNACKFFYSLGGDQLVFKTYKVEDNGVEFVIKCTNRYNQYGKYGLFLLICLINILYVAFNMLHISYSIVIYLVTMCLIFRMVRSVRRESVLIQPHLGYKIDTWYAHSRSSKFLPWSYVNDIFINEVISKHRVIFILTILTIDDKLIPLFMGSQPRLDLLELIYNKINKLER